MIRLTGYILISTVLVLGVAGCSKPDEMVTVPEGWFWQGCNSAVDACDLQLPNLGDEIFVYGDEQPYRRLHLPTFKIDKYEVTVEMYEECMIAGGCSAPETQFAECNWGVAGKEQHPVNCIDWHQAWAYCGWANKRMCSESEWEKASRGEDGRRYPWGNDLPTCQYAVMNGCGADVETMPVGSRPRGISPYGALDMSGNVWEWVEDDYHGDYEGAPTDGSAWLKLTGTLTGTERSNYRVIRGGSVFSSQSANGELRSSNRAFTSASDPCSGQELLIDRCLGYDIGFRCCR